jgi:Uri superfamily endonuclease
MRARRREGTSIAIEEGRAFYVGKAARGRQFQWVEAKSEEAAHRHVDYIEKSFSLLDYSIYNKNHQQNEFDTSIS